MTSASYPTSQRTLLFSQILAALVGGLLLFFLAVVAWTVGYQVVYAGRIFPGVSVAGVSVGGMRPAEAAVTLAQTLSYPYNGRVLFQDNGRIWVATPAELGMAFDASGSAQSAYRLGRSGGLFGSLAGELKARQHGVELSPVILFDQRIAYQYLQNIASQVNQPMVEASLSIQGTDVVAQPGQVGRQLDVDATLIALSATLQTFRDGEVALVVTQQAPQVMDVSAQEDLARRILNQPLKLVLPNAQGGDPGPWKYDVQTVANMLRVERVQNGSQTQVQLALDANALRDILTGIATQVDRAPENARFIFNDQTVQLDLIHSATIGRTLQVEASIEAINQAIQGDEHNIPLKVKTTDPDVGDNATADQLGIHELVSSETSYFYGSSADRIQNIQTAAAQFHGLLVAPGETFSMGQALGDISLDNGYAEALIIYGGRTIKGVGGGVCQVSTTLFRTVFFGGYPVVERVPHAYRVSYYEETASGGIDSKLAGLDATVYFPLVDFKFTNDTSSWLLMETYVNAGARTLTWKFYSTSDGRSVQWDTTGPQNTVPAPKPLFQKNPDLNENEIKQTDWAAEGADVDVTRTVMRDGQVYFKDEFKTHYEPWQAVCEYGPGTDDPQKLAKKKGLCQ
jgi:vancomycin resistance protein YoaR